MANTDLDLFGRKTFFIEATSDLIPESYLSDFIEKGYETYIVKEDSTTPLKEKVSAIVRLFPEAILFFNIDKSVSGIDWQKYIGELRRTLPSDIRIGVFCADKPKAEEERIKLNFVDKLKLDAGFFELNADSEENFSIIRKVLSRCGARGRRNWVRAECDESSSAKFTHNGASYNTRLLDVNETHFSCSIKNCEKDFGVFEKIRNITLSINEFSLTTDAVLIMKRISTEENLYIFMFIKADDSPALEEDKARLLNKKISQIVIKNNMQKLEASASRK